MKLNRVNRSHDLDEELMDYELELIDRAINTRKSHLRSVDELDRRDIAPKQRKACPTPKKRKFDSKLQADRVLHHIINRRQEAEASGQQYRFRQFRSYPCQNHWHHSSKPELASLESFNVA